MKSCMLIGHRDVPCGIERVLRETVVKLIKTEGAEVFYVGNHGSFDAMAWRTLTQIQREYPHIEVVEVLAYIPAKEEFPLRTEAVTLYPEGMENIPKRFAIIARNKWMVDHSDFVIAYARYSIGNASKIVQYAERKGKTVYRLNVTE